MAAYPKWTGIPYNGGVRFQSFWMLPITGIAALALALRFQPDSNARDLLWLIPSGFLLWTLLEYVFHRFIFHWGMDIFHREHHRAPRDISFLLVRFPYVLAISALVAAGLAVILGDFFRTAALMCGIWAGFLLYESVHYRVHLTGAEGRWISSRRRAHFLHHFHDSDRRFGVTTSFWDHVFRTR